MNRWLPRISLFALPCLGGLLTAGCAAPVEDADETEEPIATTQMALSVCDDSAGTSLLKNLTLGLVKKAPAGFVASAVVDTMWSASCPQKDPFEQMRAEMRAYVDDAIGSYDQSGIDLKLVACKKQAKIYNETKQQLLFDALRQDLAPCETEILPDDPKSPLGTMRWKGGNAANIVTYGTLHAGLLREAYNTWQEPRYIAELNTVVTKFHKGVDVASKDLVDTRRAQFRHTVTRRCERHFIAWCTSWGGYDVKVYDGQKVIFSGGAWDSRAAADQVGTHYLTSARNAAVAKAQRLADGYRATADAWIALLPDPCVADGGSPTCRQHVLDSGGLVGSYENHLYDRGGKNDWHWVTLSKIDGTRLRWTNRAGVSWTLTKTGSTNQLAVGADCPYYARGYRTAGIQWSADGKVSGILGPYAEPYDRAR